MLLSMKKQPNNPEKPAEQQPNVEVPAFSIANEIKSARRALKLTQAELAEGIGVDQGTVSRWERGAEPTLDNIRAITEFVARHGKVVRSIRQIVWGVGQSFRQYPVESVPVIGTVDAHGVVQITAGPTTYKKGRRADRGEYAKAPQVEAPSVTGYMDYLALVMRENSVSGLLTGWTLYFDPGFLPDLQTSTGSLCVVGMVDGAILVRRVAQGSQKSRYHLLGSNTDPIFDVRLQWVTPIAWIRTDRP
jgi:transcriptional regulator with XRE-family HTH domain